MFDLVLVTGVSGFIGGHIALELLNNGYRVRGSVRDLRKAEKVRATLAQAGADITRLDIVHLDLLHDAGWREAMDGVRYLQHAASPFVTRVPKDRDELIRPAVDGTRRALEAALDADVERIVLTSSVAAISYGGDRNRLTPYTADDWTRLGGPGVNAYIESKTLAEREAWAIVDRAGRHDDLVAINPGVVLGPLLDEDPGTSAGLVARLLNGGIPAAARIHLSVVDVRDVAAAHATGMIAGGAGGHRFPMGERVLSMLEFATILRAGMPQFASRLPRREVPDWMVRLFASIDADMRGNIGELGAVRNIDSTAVIRLLGRPLIQAPEALLATGRSLVEHGLVRAKKG